MSKILAKKANREIQIAPEKVEEYKKLGYTIIQDGKTIYKPEADAKELTAKLTAAEQASAKKDAEIASLTEKVAELTDAIAKKDAEIASLTEKVAEAEKATKS